MAKRKHPNPKSLRQGQTVYLVAPGLERFDSPHKVWPWFLHSQKVPPPDEGCCIEKMPVSLLREHLHVWRPYLFYSRRKAERAAHQANRANNKEVS